MPFTLEHRAYDHLYDPVWTTHSSTSSNNGINGGGTSNQQPVEISGKSRYKYFEKPLKAHLGPAIILAPPTSQSSAATPSTSSSSLHRESSSTRRTVAIQTDYRDGETQTLPYSPPYTIVSRPSLSPDVNETEPPEILSLRHFTSYDETLPLSERNIRRYIRRRERREGAKCLPVLNPEDESTLRMHEEFLEEQERRDFILRESEIDEEMVVTMERIEMDLEMRREEGDLRGEARVEGLRRAKMKEHEVELSTIRKKRIQVLRKLTKERDVTNATMPGGVVSSSDSHKSSSPSKKHLFKFSIKKGQYGNASTTTNNLYSSHDSAASHHQQHQHHPPLDHHQQQYHQYAQNELSIHEIEQLESLTISSLKDGHHVTTVTPYYPTKNTTTNAITSGTTAANVKSPFIKTNRKARTLANDLQLIDSLLRSREEERNAKAATAATAAAETKIVTGCKQPRRHQFGGDDDVTKTSGESRVRSASSRSKGNEVPVFARATDWEYEEEERAVLVLQKLIRGRIVRDRFEREILYHAQ